MTQKFAVTCGSGVQSIFPWVLVELAVADTWTKLKKNRWKSYWLFTFVMLVRTGGKKQLIGVRSDDWPLYSTFEMERCGFQGNTWAGLTLQHSSRGLHWHLTEPYVTSTISLSSHAKGLPRSFLSAHDRENRFLCRNSCLPRLPTLKFGREKNKRGTFMQFKLCHKKTHFYLTQMR